MSKLYSGDILATEAMDILKNNPDAQLVDVRTFAEWHYVGTPDLNSLKKEVICIEWRQLPSMDLNPAFIQVLENKIPSRDTELLFLCRTGGRSREAAIAMTARGYKTCYNIESGFEGDLNPQKHRGSTSGWKASKLPWRQD
jgi:rhodanese-related sulfurtransferase